MISETVSKKRGRPELPVNPMLYSLHPEVETRRSIQNKFYVAQAYRALGVEDAPGQYPWFAGEGRGHRQGILVELGRIAFQFGDATARVFADVLMDRYGDGAGVATRDVAAMLQDVRINGLSATMGEGQK